MKYLCCFICYSLFLFSHAYAQREATQWLLGNKVRINFNQNPPLVIYDELAPQVFSQQLATISDKDGNLLFYTDSQTVWNKQNQEMPNGTNIGGERLRKVIIVPAPGRFGKYYIFTLGFTNAVGDYFIDQHVVYALVDVEANNGAGQVLEKNKILYKNLHGSFTISARCENGTYWLVGETNENILPAIGTDRIYAYRIDEKGVSDTPVISSPVSIGNSGGYKFSPASDKIVFSYDGNGPSATAIADFDQATGRVSNLINIAACCSHVAEFSSNGKMLYLSQDSTLLQYDISSNDLSAILNSRNVITNRGSYIGGLQLAPDGKIYVSRANSTVLSVIENPDLAGEACNYKTNGLLLGTDSPYYLPSFATNLLYNAPTNTALAGDDKQVCVNKSTLLGNTAINSVTYLWEPAAFLDNPNLPNPTFRYTQPTDTTVVLSYRVTVNDGVCPRTDIVKVSVQPLPERPQIRGSRSVCPGVEGVAYQVKAREGYTYQWKAEGGNIVNGQGSTAIQVNWAKSRPNAYVQVTAISTSGCESQTVFNVRINPELQTETPEGASQVCLNDKNGQLYKVTRTNGSVYTWGVKGGMLVSGQGTDQVKVNWNGEGTHQLWLQEKSITLDTVCYGASDTLAVSVFKDESSLDFRFVSISGNSLSDIQGQLLTNLNFADSVFIYRSKSGQDNWVKVASVNPSGNIITYTDTGLSAEENSYRYKLSTVNFCEEIIESDVHQTIRLAAEVKESPADKSIEQIYLTWNAYEGWKNSIAAYQLWRRLDKEETYTLIATVAANHLNYLIPATTDGFVHEYKVKAIESLTRYESSSNEIKLEFLHELYIPNVFTPNGDGANDSFEIKNIHLYPENELVIYNRWGKEVFRQRSYEGNWQADGLHNGIYFYEFSAKQLNRYYKGMLQVLR
jgi:gliding motility-associated-like protein